MDRQVPNHLETLGLAPGASTAHIKRAYLALVKRWHPDRFTHDPEQQKLAEEKLRTINVAYEALVGEARVTVAFQHGSSAPEYDPADPAINTERRGYAYRERPSAFAVWRGQVGWLSWAGTLVLVAISISSFWFVAESLAYHYGPPYTADFIRHEAKLQSVLARTRRAAEAGEVWAAVNMGWFHYQGRAVRVNKTEAAVWFARAAQAGDAGAQTQLGAMLATGDGVPVDTVMARLWLELAAANGHAEAQRQLKGLRQ
ncbi:MAG: hypothetical protein B9S33_03840 [Pedosphaera sp. Tous-C6FEB]|nr:MAG: hypothetical protein B9S33_03840 [Pedosphaera sp. Tous-C6FEB]